MLARLAENLFWGGRYLERAEDTTRLIDVTHHVLLEAPPAEVERTWDAVLDQLHVSYAFAEWRSKQDASLSLTDAVLRYLVVERDNPGAVLSCMWAARENARSVRELISAEVWEAMNGLFLKLSSRDIAAEVVDRPYDVFATVKLGCQTVIGVLTETMPRDEAYRFVMLGRMLERAEMTARLIDTRYEQLVLDTSPRQRVALLRSIGALESFRRRYGVSTDANDVLALLLLDADHPRSVLFALDRAEEQLVRIGSGRGPAARELGRARAGLRYRDVPELLEADLHEFLEQLQSRIRDTAEAIAAEFFRHTPPGAMVAVATA